MTSATLRVGITTSLIAAALFGVASAQSIMVPASVSPVSPCAVSAITSDLSRGTTNTFVATLQDFLSQQGFFSGASIGIFGPATQRAVIAFQSSRGVPSTGYVGPLTRAAMLRSCDTPQPVATNVKIYSITPTSGPTGTQVTIDGFGFTNDNTIHFGNGVVMHVPVSGQIAIACTTNSSCVPGIHQTLVFTVPNGLTPSCFYSEPRCMILTQQTVPGNYNVSVENTNGTSNSQTFTVTGGTTSALRLDGLSPTSGPTGTSVTLYGAGFTQSSVVRFAEGSVPATASPDGTQLTFTVPTSVGPYCLPNMMCAMYMRLVTPGSYDVYVQNTDGSVVTNKLSFAVTSGASNGIVSISGLDAPTTLPLGTTGVWTVHVTANSAFPNLKYSVVWGDENATYQMGLRAPLATTIQATGNFTHVYQQAGTYTPVFTVTDDSGRSATASATVIVTPLY